MPTRFSNTREHPVVAGRRRTQDAADIPQASTVDTSRPVTVVSESTASHPVVVVSPVVSTTTVPTWTR